MKEFGEATGFINGEVLNGVDLLEQHQKSVCCRLNDHESFLKSKKNKMECAKNIFDNSTELHSSSQSYGMATNSFKIKSENISDIDENEEYLYVMDTKTEWKEGTLQDLPQNADTKITLHFKGSGVHCSKSQSYRVTNSSTEIKSESISNMEEREKSLYALSNAAECQIYPLKEEMECTIEDTRILFPTQVEFTTFYDTCASTIKNSSQLENAAVPDFVTTPASPYKRRKMLSRNLPNQVDDTEIFPLKEDLRVGNKTSSKVPDLEKSGNASAVYNLECDTSRKVQQYKCPDCDMSLVTKQSLKRHRMFRHSNLKPYKCSNCEKCFVTKSNLDQHEMYWHSKPKPHQCTDCEKSFVTKNILNEHQMSQHSKPKPYNCRDCERSFVRKATLHRHQLSMHSKLKPYKCPDCEKNFSTKQTLERHQMFQHPKLKDHACPECDQSFVTKINLDQHQMSRHSKPRPHQCPECEKSFVAKQSLERHQMFRHSKPKPHKCPECDQSFVTKFDLDRHQMYRHSKPRPHKCGDCEKSFVTKQTLERHRMYRHLKLKPFQCPDCEKSFVRKTNRDHHKCTNIPNQDLTSLPTVKGGSSQDTP